MRQFLKKLLPKPIRDILRLFLHYFVRLWYWLMIFKEMRGKSFTDHIKLLASALAAPIFSLKNLSGWQNPVLLFDTDVYVYGIGYFQLRKQTDDLFHVLPTRERSIVDLLFSQLSAGDHFADVGANIGFYTILAAHKVGDKGSVTAVEMIPQTADRLRAHLEMNNLSNVTIVQQAVSDESGQTVAAQVPINEYGKASISGNLKDENLETIEVKTTTLNDIFSEAKNIKVMKLDLEGVEPMALKGASKIMNKVDHIVYETLGTDRPDATEEILNSYNFKSSTLDGRNLVATK